MKCVKCGKTIPENSKFCQYCGTSLERSKKIDTDNKNVVECPACGAKIKKENSFCTNCGVALQEISRPKTEQKVSKKKQNKGVNLFLILIIVVIAILISMVSLYFLKSVNNDARVNYIEATEDDFFDEGSLSDTEDEVMTEGQSVDSTQSTESNIDIDNEVEQINNQCDSIESSISAGTYNTIDIENGIIAYYDSTGLKAILDKEDGNYYYFDNDNLIFVYYETIHPYKFYFRDGQLIRWSYLPSPGDDLNAVNNDQDKSWESSVLEEAEDLINKWVLALASVSTTQGNATTTQPVANTTQINENISKEYVLDGSDSRYISSSELDGLTAQEVKLARNEIYARHGRKFDDKSIRKYFKQFAWYNPSIDPEDFDESILNNYEIANRDLIIQYEEKHGYR